MFADTATAVGKLLAKPPWPHLGQMILSKAMSASNSALATAGQGPGTVDHSWTTTSSPGSRIVFAARSHHGMFCLLYGKSFFVSLVPNISDTPKNRFQHVIWNKFLVRSADDPLKAPV